MPFSTSFSPELKEKLARLFKKDRRRYDILMKKIDQISECGEFELEHFKNLRHDLSDYKRVHIDKSFVLTFKVDKQKRVIFFADFDHHDNIYEK